MKKRQSRRRGERPLQKIARFSLRWKKRTENRDQGTEGTRDQETGTKGTRERRRVSELASQQVSGRAQKEQGTRDQGPREQGNERPGGVR
jgi:hypothetical protein